MESRPPKPQTSEASNKRSVRIQEGMLHSEEKTFPSLPRFSPCVDFAECEKAFYVRMDVKDMKKEDVKIRFSGNQLTISGERKFKEEEDGKFFHILETGYGVFSRSFYLSDNIEPDKMEAAYSEGCLNIRVPKLVQQ